MRAQRIAQIVLVASVAMIAAACATQAAPTAAPAAPTSAPAPVAPTAAPAPAQATAAPAATTAQEMVDTTKFKKAGPYKIGFSNISVVNSWRVQMVRELQYEATQHSDISQLYVTDAGGDVNKQIADIEDLLTKGVDALLVTPASPDAIVPVVQKALSQGVPVVVFNSSLTGHPETAYVATDEVDFGYVIAKWLMQQLNCQGKIIALDGIAGNSITNDRFAGLQKAINACPDPSKIDILSRDPADWAFDKGKIAAEKDLAAYPNIDGVWSQGGAMTQGAMEAFVAANRPLVPMTGEDNNGFLKLWKQLQPKGFKGIAASEPTWLSAEALKTALDILGGKPVAKSNIIPVPTITDETLGKYVRPDLSDDYWANSHLPAALATQYYGSGTTTP
ncbi:MAG: ABC transporter substrate-binding protein [Chloroflexi bacterium]|nr:ABC transporter substrate-binding protein [Chloroflexota bacterium]